MKSTFTLFILVTTLLWCTGTLRAQGNSAQGPNLLPTLRFGHVAIALPSGATLERAMEWYGDTMGFEKAWDIKEIDMNDRAASALPRMLFGEGFQKLRYVKMSAGNKGMAIELFELVGLVSPPVSAYHVTRGYVHLCMTVDKPEALAGRIVRAGGKELWRSAPGKGVMVLFCSDPYGNVIEVSCPPAGVERP